MQKKPLPGKAGSLPFIKKKVSARRGGREKGGLLPVGISGYSRVTWARGGGRVPRLPRPAPGRGRMQQMGARSARRGGGPGPREPGLEASLPAPRGLVNKGHRLSAGVLRVPSYRTSRPDPKGEGPRAVPTQAGRRTREGGRAPGTHLEDQPRHLTRYSSLPCGERRAGGEPRRAPGARGGRAGTHAPCGAAYSECTQRRRPARPRCSAPPCRRPPRPAPRRPRPTVAHKAPPPPRPAPRTRVAVARAALPGATRPIGARGGARIVRGGGGEDRSVGLGSLCAAWRGCVFRGSNRPGSHVPAGSHCLG